jgi:hypothetical protein
MGRRWRRLALLTGILSSVVGVGAFAVWRWEAYRHRVAPTDVGTRPFDPPGGRRVVRHSATGWPAT